MMVYNNSNNKNIIVVIAIEFTFLAIEKTINCTYCVKFNFDSRLYFLLQIILAIFAHTTIPNNVNLL